MIILKVLSPSYFEAQLGVEGDQKDFREQLTHSQGLGGQMVGLFDPYSVIGHLRGRQGTDEGKRGRRETWWIVWKGRERGNTGEGDDGDLPPSQHLVC